MNGSLACSYDGYVEAVLEMASAREIVTIESKKTKEDEPASSGRLEVGLAEQNMILMASGLALEGKRVFVSAPFSPIFPARSYEQIRAAVALPNARVVLSSVQDGATLDRDGAVRQMNEDFAIMRVMPNMAVLAPSDRNSAAAIARSLLRHDGPVYVRLSYEKSRQIYEAGDDDFHVGGGRLLTEGDGVTIQLEIGRASCRERV